jgi:hypothetical protein
MTSARAAGRYEEPDPGPKEHTMGQVIVTALSPGDRR